MLANTYVCEVEFVGGPIDGHTEALVLPLHTYVGVKVLWSLEDDDAQNLSVRSSPSNPSPSSPMTRIAIYQIDNSRSRVGYRFVRTQLLSDQTRATEEVLKSLIQDDRRDD